jgi:hypothetical protein
MRGTEECADGREAPRGLVMQSQHIRNDHDRPSVRAGWKSVAEPADQGNPKRF